MTISHWPFVTKLRRVVLETPLYRPLRFVFNRILLINAQRTVQIEDVSMTFSTPTFKIVDDLETLAEKDLLLSLLDATRKGDTVWDIGANFGLYTLFAARATGETGCVAAFEPEPKTRQLLKRNIMLNKLRNVTVFDYALDRENGSDVLYPSATANPGSHSLVRRTDYRVKRGGIRVQTRRGDDVVREERVRPPAILKIDVEGAEMNVLIGMSSLLRDTMLRTMLVEVHPNVLPLFGKSAHDVDSLVQSSGFSSITHIDRGTEYHLLCQRT